MRKLQMVCWVPLLTMMTVTGEPRWGIMTTFPLPMPVMHDAKVFPRLFTTNKTLGLAFLPMDDQVHHVNNNRTFSLLGSLCFVIVRSLNDNTSCIPLYNQSAAWLQAPSWGDKGDIVTNATVISGWWPAGTKRSVPLSQPKLAPFCRGTMTDDLLLPWTGCQAREASWAVTNYFTFSPNINTYFNSTFAGYNFTYMDPARSNINPFDQWLLCGVNGSCTDLSPVVMSRGGFAAKGQLQFEWSGKASGAGPFSWTSTVKSYKDFKRTNFVPTPICVWPPFVWIISNSSTISNTLSCTPSTCFFALCWNASAHHFAMVARLPRFIPVPVEAPNSLSLFRVKRDFGISAVIVGIIAAAAVAASVTASALALSTSVQTAETINGLSTAVTSALDEQVSANSQILGGLMLVNQRIDLIQEQLDILWQMAQLGCEQKLSGLCITSIQYENFTRAANLSKALSQFLLQNWTAEFEETLRKLRFAIVHVNSTRLDLSLTQGLSSWISAALSYFKEWVGVGVFGAALACGIVFCLWVLCRMKRKHERDQVRLVKHC